MTNKNECKIFYIMNIAAPVYCIMMQFIVGFVTYCVCIPAVYFEDKNKQLWHKVGFAIFMLGLLINYLLCMLTKSTLGRNQSSASPTSLPIYASGSMKEWTFCSSCRLDMPPRCHHCPICNACILKRISHCFFVGRCVGHYNQRYYVSFLIYTIIVAFYSLLVYLGYLYDYFGSPLSFDVIGFLYPIAVGQFILGKIPLNSLLLLTLMYQCLMYTVGCTFLLFQAFIQIINGQTPHEANNRNFMYKSSLKENLQVVFGRRWLLALILPWPTRLPGDGMTWEMSNRTKVL